MHFLDRKLYEIVVSSGVDVKLLTCLQSPVVEVLTGSECRAGSSSRLLRLPCSTLSTTVPLSPAGLRSR